MQLSGFYQNTGDLRKARQLIEEAQAEFALTQDTYGKVLILNGLGYLLLAMGDAPGASRRFAEAGESAISLGREAMIHECRAGQAACAILQGQLDEARRYASEAWKYLQEHGPVGTLNRARLCRVCAETFDALGEVEKAREAIELGHQLLVEMPGKINNPAWRQSFLENVPDNRAIMEMWEPRKQ